MTLRAPVSPPTTAPRSTSPRWWRSPSLAAGLLAGVLLVAAAVVSVHPLHSPSAPRQASVEGFPLAQARADLAVVAATAHPLGTPAQRNVEAFLVGQLRSMGIDPQLQAQTVTLTPDAAHSVWTAPVRNILVRIRGTAPDHTDAVMVAAHYDSVPTAAGAGDNGGGVVAALETLRVLAAGPPPRHDVIGAFIDGEEHEMLGSKAFVDHHPWAHDVRVALNTEGVGDAGRVTPALTTRRNGWVLRQYLQTADPAVVYTAFDAPLNALDMGADLGRYQDVVPAGLEFSVIGGLPAYHAGTDTAAAMNVGTLAEYGRVMLNLTRHVANADLGGDVTATDLVAFTLTDHVTVAYPSSWSLPLALVAALAVLAAIGFAVRRGRVRPRRAITAWLTLGGAVVAGVAAGTGAWLLARAVDPRLSDAVNGGSYHRSAFILAACTAGLAAMLLVAWPLRRRHTGSEVLAGGLLGVAVLAMLLAVTLPTAAYVATWPALAGAAALAVVTARRWSAAATVATGTAAALPVVLLVAPLVVVYFLLAARFELTMGILGTPLPLLWLLIGLAVVLPLMTLAVRRIRWQPAAVAAGVAVGLVATGAVIDATDTTHPRPDALVYTVNADTGVARWVAVPGVDGYTGQVATRGWRSTTFEAEPFHRVGTMFGAQQVAAPTVDATPDQLPRAAVIRTATSAERRLVTLDAQAPTGAYALTVDLRAAGGIRSVTVEGTPAADAAKGRPDQVRVVAFSPRGAVPIVVSVGAGATLRVTLTSYQSGFPAPLQVRIHPRGRSQTTAVYEVPDATVLTRTMTVAGRP